jgi:aspartokinase/homoserine dehydrogenase 1
VPGVAGRMFSALGESNVNIRAIAQGSSEHNITVIIAHKDLENAIHVLYETFINNNGEE